MAAYTRLDVLKSVLYHLSYPLGVNKELTCHANCVYSSLGNCFGSNGRVHSSRTNHGNINKLLYMCYVLKVAVFGHIHRGVSPVPRVISAVIGIKHIVARILQIPCGSFGLLHISSHLGIFFSGHCTLAKALHFRFYRIAERYGIILTARLLYSLNDLCCKAVAILKASAVLVGTLIKEFYCKLVEQISLVNSVYLYSVNARFLTKLCSFCKRLYYFVYLLLCHLGALYIMSPTGFLGAGACKLV